MLRSAEIASLLNPRNLHLVNTSEGSVIMRRLKILLPTLLGTLIESYDYALYGFSANKIASHFFPAQEHSSALIKVFGIFVAGALAKPLGALIFGHIGDRYGRSIALKINMVGIAIPTFLVGIMLGYDQIGYWAAVFLLLCRLCQGIFLSGESDGVRIYLFESLGKTRPCFAISLFAITYMIGVFFASLVVTVFASSEFSQEAFRIPFLIGGGLAALVIFVRRYLVEPEEFLQFAKKKTYLNRTEPLIKVLLNNKKAILLTALLYGAVGGDYHFYLVFWGNYLSGSVGILEGTQASLAITQAIVVYTLFAPIAGILSDRFGPIMVMKTAIAAFFVMVLLNIVMLWQNMMPMWVIFLTVIAQSFFHTPAYVILFDRFSVGERYRCVSLGHSLGSILLSGSAPVVGLWIWDITGLSYAPLFYFMALAATSLSVVLWYERTEISESLTKLQAKMGSKTSDLNIRADTPIRVS
jgi:MFS transporter, MHS family, proline/betaine transporter